MSAHRLPIITTQRTNNDPELMLPNAMWRVPPGRTDSLAQAMEQVLGDAALRRQLTIGSARLHDTVYHTDRSMIKTVHALGLEVKMTEQVKRAA